MMSTKFIVLAAGAGALAVGQADALSLKRGFLGLGALKNALTGRKEPFASRRTTAVAGMRANHLRPGAYESIEFDTPVSGDRIDRNNPVVKAAVMYPHGVSLAKGSQQKKTSSKAKTLTGSMDELWTARDKARSETNSVETSSSGSTVGSNSNLSRGSSPPRSVAVSETPTEKMKRWSGSLEKKEGVNTAQAKLNAVADRFAVARQDNLVMQQLEQSATSKSYWGGQRRSQQAPSKVSSNHVRNVGSSPRVDNGMRRLSEAKKQQQRRAEGAKAEAAALRQLDNARAKGYPLETTQALGWKAKQAASRRAGTDNIFLTAHERRVLGMA